MNFEEKQKVDIDLTEYIKHIPPAKETAILQFQGKKVQITYGLN